MEHQNEAEVRRGKLARLREQGIDPYPSATQRTCSVRAFLEQFAELSESGATQTLAGRIQLSRSHGKILFLQLQDETGRIQLVASQEQLSTAQYEFLTSLIDVGDIVQVTGSAFTTKKGESSLLLQNVRLLAKALEPLPDKWHGIQDEETRYRKRYLEMIMNPGLRELFVQKSLFWQSVRDFLREEGFLEVETPVLEATPGGADAEPFITHHNALDVDLYLRISMGELWQKRLMVGGFERTFEIGRQFRNEGISAEHLQDYTQMEFYWAFANYEQGMELVERMFKHVIQRTFGTLQFQIHGFPINFAGEWPRLDYRTVIQEQLGVDIATMDDAGLHAAAEKLGLNHSSVVGRGRLIDLLWKQCRKSIAGPAFLVNHPVEVSPLAKRRADDPETVERFQIIIAGSELGNGYSELNDPLDQQNRFLQQAALREAGDAEAQMHDQDFVEALSYGMPPTCGFGFSERLFAFLVDKPIRECVLFPLQRPKGPAATTSPSESQPTITPTGVDPSLQPIDPGLTREAALSLMEAKVKDPGLRRHMLATETIMEALARRFGAASPEAWGLAGLLHDIDWEETPPERHSLVGADWLAEAGVDGLLVAAVREHNHLHGFTPQTLLSKTLLSLEQLTGLVIAATLVRPDKKIASVKASSIKKKLKDSAFARGVSREMIGRVEELTGLSLDEAIEISLSAMQADAKKLGFD